MHERLAAFVELDIELPVPAIPKNMNAASTCCPLMDYDSRFSNSKPHHGFNPLLQGPMASAKDMYHTHSVMKEQQGLERPEIPVCTEGSDLRLAQLFSRQRSLSPPPMHTQTVTGPKQLQLRFVNNQR